MSELGDDFKAWREDKRDKKENNYNRALDLLAEHGIKFERLSESHLRIGEIDYWPSTGLFINRKTKKRGRGIINLIKAVSAEKE